MTILQTRTVELSISDVMKQTVIEVKVTGVRQFRVRTWIAFGLIRMAIWIFGAGFKWSFEFPGWAGREAGRAEDAGLEDIGQPSNLPLGEIDDKRTAAQIELYRQFLPEMK